MRGLRRRLDQLWGDRESDAVVAALMSIHESGQVPSGDAGARAEKLWQEAGEDGVVGYTRFLRAYLRATGMTLADIVVEAYERRRKDAAS